MNQKGISSIVIILIIVGVLVVAGGVYWWQVKPSVPIVGGDTDEHGCKGSAGYSWCAEKNKCLRVWEEPCTASKDETANWKTYSWVQECGNFEIKYPNNWKTGEITSDRLGCSGNLSYISNGYSSFSQAVDAGADQAVALNLSYSDTSAVAETTFEKLKEKIKESPQKSFFPGILQCIKEDHGTFFSIECGATKDKGIYFISGDVIKFEDQINQMLSTFKFTSQ